LVFDQFEELFSHNRDTPLRIEAIFDPIADLVENRIPAELAGGALGRERRSQLDLRAQPYRVVLSFREDFLPEIEAWTHKLPSLLGKRLRLLPMSPAQALRAVERAGAAVLEEGAAAQIVDLVTRGD